MNTFPKIYSKGKFIEFLKKNNVNDGIIAKFAELPEYVTRSGYTFDLYINVTWYNIGNTYYEFELNYYSENLIEYVFNSKIFKDVEYSINNLLCELMDSNCIEVRKKK
jgi:hypothetical protein